MKQGTLKIYLINIISVVLIISVILFIFNANKFFTYIEDRDINFINNNPSTDIKNYEIEDFNRRVGIAINTIDGRQYTFIDATLKHNTFADIIHQGRIIEVQTLYFGGEASSVRLLFIIEKNIDKLM